MKTKILILSLTAAFFMNNAYAQKSSFDPSILGDTPELTIETTMGNITVKLYKETPLHRDNFLKLAAEGYYDGVIFHRVIENFMIQTGDPDSKNPKPGKTYGMGGPDYRIPAELVKGIYHKKGALAAARDNNPQKASSGSQFYIVEGEVLPIDFLTQRMRNLTPEQKEIYSTIGGTPHLDGEYTVFGEVTDGLDVVDKIASVKTGQQDRPVTDVLIVRIVPAKK